MFNRIFDRIYCEFEILKSIIKNKIETVMDLCASVDKGINQINSKLDRISKLSDMEKTIESQQRTIEALTNALQDKYEKGLFIYSEDCKMTKVIRNGKELTNPYVRSLCVNWEYGGAPEITIDEIAGTTSDEE